jgi:hypothetical protein
MQLGKQTRFESQLASPFTEQPKESLQAGIGASWSTGGKNRETVKW